MLHELYFTSRDSAELAALFAFRESIQHADFWTIGKALNLKINYTSKKISEQFVASGTLRLSRPRHADLSLDISVRQHTSTLPYSDYLSVDYQSLSVEYRFTGSCTAFRSLSCRQEPAPCTLILNALANYFPS